MASSVGKAGQRGPLWYRGIAIMVTAALVAGIAGCGGEDDDSTPPPTVVSPPALTPAAAQVVITTTDSPADAFTLESSAKVNISAAADVLSKSTIKLNGIDVTKSFAITSATTATGSLASLNTGPNVLTVSDAQTGAVTYAQRTITRSVPLKVACSALVGLSIPASAINAPTTGATITVATDIAAIPAPIVTNNTTQLATPQYCQVRGTISPVDVTAPVINFQVDLPVAWNQKLAQLGGSGFNGVIPIALTGANMRVGPESLPPDAPYAITRGFVTYGSDSGHQGNSSAANPWSLNRESFLNYGYQQIKKTHDVAVQVAIAAYGLQPRKTYYFGTSTGGREALQAAQRYPDDYDGILSQLPVIAWPELTTYRNIKAQQAQLGSGWIPPAKVAIIDAEVRRQCDGLDGIVDGYNASTFECNKLFDPQLVANPYANIRCQNGLDTGDTCLSDPQIATLNVFHSPNKYSFDLGNNITSFAGWPVGGESTANGPYARTQPSLSNANAPDAFMAATVRSTTFNSLTFRPEDYVSGVQYVASVVYATDPDLNRFSAKGGKLLLKSNSTDYTASPRLITQYYDSVVHAMGQGRVDSFMRYYSVIGAWHNSNIGFNTVTGANTPYFVDWIAMLDKWVEDGIVPPDNPTVTFQGPVPPFAVQSSLPMCRYPTTPHYVSGDPLAAASYACRKEANAP